MNWFKSRVEDARGLWHRVSRIGRAEEETDEAFKELVERRVDSRYYLHGSAQLGSVPLCRRFLNQGYDANATDRFQRTPMHYAAETGSLELVEYLASQAADPYAKTLGYQYSVLHIAACNGHTEICRFLLRMGQADGIDDVAGRFGECSAASMAARGVHRDVVELLISHGASPLLPVPDYSKRALHASPPRVWPEGATVWDVLAEAEFRAFKAGCGSDGRTRTWDPANHWAWPPVFRSLVLTVLLIHNRAAQARAQAAADLDLGGLSMRVMLRIIRHLAEVWYDAQLAQLESENARTMDDPEVSMMQESQSDSTHDSDTVAS